MEAEEKISMSRPVVKTLGLALEVSIAQVEGKVERWEEKEKI